MAIEHSAQADPRSFKIDGKLLARVWRLTRPFWLRREAWPAWAMLGVIVILIAISASTIAWASFRMKDLTDAIVGKQWDVFLRSAGLYLALTLVATVIVQPAIQVITEWLSQRWRHWLSLHLIDKYLAERAYYDIAQQGDLDNPDQRLQESVFLLSKSLLGIPLALINQTATVTASLAVIAALDPRLTFYALIIAIAQIVTKYLAVTPAIRLNYKAMVAEGDLRFSLVRVRENAEGIAFYQGEASERDTIAGRLIEAVRRQLHVQYYEAFLLTFLPRIFNLAWIMLPFMTLGPRVISGELTFGAITQTSAVTSQIMMSVMLLSAMLPMLGQAAPHAIRLAEIEERLDALRAEHRRPTQARLHMDRDGDGIALRNVSLRTPDGRQPLVQHLDLTIPAGRNVAIVGETGVGKSSLLRCMAGLWTNGDGAIAMPPCQDCLFLPQRPYMALANLRSQLAYPGPELHSDEVLHAALNAVRLPELANRSGGLDAALDWGRILSLGEQQRLGFARILLNRPRFIFLDEATSAVDAETEARLYELLSGTGSTFVSVGHRAGILRHHSHILTLLPGGGWRFEAQPIHLVS